VSTDEGSSFDSPSSSALTEVNEEKTKRARNIQEIQTLDLAAIRERERERERSELDGAFDFRQETVLPGQLFVCEEKPATLFVVTAAMSSVANEPRIN